MAAQKAGNKKKKSTKDSSPGTSIHVNVDDTNEDNSESVTPGNVPPDTDAPKRPMGKKKAKDSFHRGGNDACIQALDVLWAKKKEADADKEIKKDERYAKIFALDQERLELEKKRIENEEKMLANEEKKLANEEKKLVNKANNLQMKKMAEEDRIISMDTSWMNDLQREYYSHKQAEIMARRMTNSC